MDTNQPKPKNLWENDLNWSAPDAVEAAGAGAEAIRSSTWGEGALPRRNGADEMVALADQWTS